VELAALASHHLKLQLSGSYLTERNNHILVVALILNQRGGTLIELLDSFRGKHNEQKPVVYLFQTIFYGNPCHGM
jgi:hypothetical protein